MYDDVLLCWLHYQDALRVLLAVFAKHAGSSNHAAQQNVIMHKLYYFATKSWRIQGVPTDF